MPIYSDGRISSDVALDASDLQIGAVELKNATTDTRVTVLAASTASQATDTPAVVALHPSSPLPAGTAAIGKLAANAGVTIGAVEIAAAQTLATVTTVGAVTAITNALPAGEAHIGQVGGQATNPSGNFTRPNDTTAYASGDLVANSTTAGSVDAVSITVSRVAAGSFMLRRCKLHKSGTTTTNALFRVHLFRADPATVTNGDNGAFSVSGVADYVGGFDVTVDRAFTDGAAGFGVPVVGSEMTVKLASGSVLYAMVEARAAYTPAANEVFTITLDDLQD